MTLVTGQALSQQTELKGRVSVHNSRYQTGTVQYVQDAYVTAPFATADNTDSEGVFTLVFVGMGSGTTVRVQAEKAGLEVVNTRDLQRVVIGRRDPLPIYLAEKGKLAQAQTELYHISKQALYAQRDALIVRLRSEGEQGEAAIVELQQRLGQEVTDRFQAEELLNDRIAALEKKLPSFARELAAQNLDFASDLYITAYERYKEGDIAGAVALLDSTALADTYQEAVSTLAEGERLDSIATDLMQKGRRLLRQTIDSYALKAEGLALLFSYGEAARQYQQITAIYKENGLDSLELAEWYDKLGDTYRDGGRYPEALKTHRQALSLREEVLDPGHPDLATSYSYIAMAYRYGDFRGALEYGLRALAIQEKVLDPKHPDLAVSYSSVAWAYRSLKDYPKALEYHQRAIAIQEEVLGPDHPDLAVSYGDIAWAYQFSGEYQRALEYDLKAIAILEEKLGSKHPKLAFYYNGTAVAHKYLGEFQRALEYHKRAIAIQEEVLGPRHPELAVSYNDIGLLYNRLGKYGKALDYHLRTIGIAEAVVDPENPYLATAYNNIAQTYHNLGDYRKALEYDWRAHATWEELLDSKHPSLAFSYGSVAWRYHSLGEYQRALEYYRKALSIQEEVLNPKHPDLAISYNGLGNTYKTMEEYDKAMAYLEKALAIREEALPENHADLATSHHDMGRCLYEMGRYGDALEHLAKALAIRQESLPEDHPDLATSHHDMGRCLYAMGRYDDALGHLAKTMAIRQEALPESHPDRVETFGSLGLAYAKHGQFEQAQQALEEYERLSPDKGGPHRNWALYHALVGDNEKALAGLQRAMELGYDDVKWIEGEEAFEGLRGTEAYKELIRELRVKN